MNLKLFNHRDFSDRKFIYQNQPADSGAEEIEPEKAREEFEKEFFKDIDLPKDTKPENIKKFVFKVFVKKFNPEKYENGLKTYVDKLKNDQKIKNEKYVDTLVEESVKRYKKAYEISLQKCERNTKIRLSDYETLKNDIISSTRNSLDKLRADIDATRNADRTLPEHEKVPAPADKGDRWTYKIPIAGPIFRSADIPIISWIIDSKEYINYRKFQRETQDKYKQFIEARSKQYFESKLYADKLMPESKKLYGELSDRFKKGIANHMEMQLEFIFKNSKNKDELKSNLEALRDRLLRYYEMYDANTDGILDLNELKKLDYETGQVKVANLINTFDDESELAKNLEALNFFDNKVWQNAVAMMTEQLLAETVKSGAEGKFIDHLAKKTGKKNLDFDKAADLFRDIMKNMAKTGVKETLSAFKEFNDAVNKERAEILKMDDIKPPVFRELVYNQRRLILDKRYKELPSVHDRAVAEFMSGSLVERTMILDDPDRREKLFKAIRNIIQYYPEEYRKRVGTRKDFKTRSLHPEEPTADDKLAIIPAMLILAREAEWIVQNLDSANRNKGKKYSEELAKTDYSKTRPLIKTNIVSVDKLYSTQYVTAAERGGFNGRDIAIGALKIWAGTTLFLNFMNARKQAEGRGVEKWINGMTAMATNPYFLGGAAVVFGTHKIQQNPEVLDYFKDPDRISTYLALGEITKKEGKDSVLRYVCNTYEFQAMKVIMQEPKAGVNMVKQLLKKAQDRATKEKSNNPVLTKEDLADTLGRESKAWIMLPSAGNDRVRYLFYRSLLSTERDIDQLEDNCKKWI